MKGESLRSISPFKSNEVRFTVVDTTSAFSYSSRTSRSPSKDISDRNLFPVSRNPGNSKLETPWAIILPRHSPSLLAMAPTETRSCELHYPPTM